MWGGGLCVVVGFWVCFVFLWLFFGFGFSWFLCIFLGGEG